MYSDISGGEHTLFLIGAKVHNFLEFLLGYPGTNVSWAFVDDGTNIILSEQFIQPASFSESGDHALDAEEYYCYKRVSFTPVYYPHSPNCLHMLCA